MPLWAEEKLNEIVNKFIEKGLNANDLQQIRLELEEVGLDKFMPVAITTISGRK